MSFLCTLGVHRWSLWESFFEKGTVTLVGYEYPPEVRGETIPYSKLKQLRTCKRCGKTVIYTRE